MSGAAAGSGGYQESWAADFNPGSFLQEYASDVGAPPTELDDLAACGGDHDRADLLACARLAGWDLSAGGASQRDIDDHVIMADVSDADVAGVSDVSDVGDVIEG